MFFVLAGVFMGVQLELDGTNWWSTALRMSVGSGCLSARRLVFFFQLLRPAFQKGLKSVSGPKFICPPLMAPR
ncbi:DUF3382 domain-containing protein [Shigella flexneri]